MAMFGGREERAGRNGESRGEMGPWSLEGFAYPEEASVETRLRFLLRHAVLAPSSHNSQPWRFAIEDGAVALFADRSRALPVVDPLDRELTISCGAALFFLRLSMRRYGHLDETELFPDVDDPDLLARVRFGGPRAPTDDELRMFEAIPRRHTNRKPFERRSIRRRLLASLENAAELEGAWLAPIHDEDKRQAIAELVSLGDRMQASNPSFRRELASWVHPNRTRSKDGMPGWSLGMGDVKSYAGPIVLRTFDWGRGQAARDHEIALGSPLLAVLGTDTDTPMAWLQAGQALARLLLLAAAEGASASYLNQPIEVEELRPRLEQLVGHAGHAQLLLRMGYGMAGPHTPRRDVDDVLGS